MFPKMMLIKTVLFICLLLGTTFRRVQGEKCNENRFSLIATFVTSTLTSPGHPQNYEDNDNCDWLITAVTSSYYLQLVAQEFDLSDPNNDCTGDYVDILTGDSFNSLKKNGTWCGSGLKIFNTEQKFIVLQFHSDANSTGKGFVVDYNLIDVFDLQCREDVYGHVKIGPSPVFATFKGEKDVKNCQWRIEGKMEDSSLVYELVTPSGVSCANGRYLFTEGVSSNDQIQFEYCSTTQPFSTIFLKSNVAILKYEHDGKKNPDGLTLKIYQRKLYVDSCNGDAVKIDVIEAPVFFFLPYALNTNGEKCSVHLSTKPSAHLRVDIMRSADGSISCDSDFLGSNDQSFRKSCNREGNPSYFADSSSLEVSLQSSIGAFVRAAPVAIDCDSLSKQLIATEDLIIKTTIPEDPKYNNLDKCARLINAESPSDLVYLKVNWTLPHDESNVITAGQTCPGDFLNVFDGTSSSDPLLYSSCSGMDGQRQHIETTVISSQKYLYVELDTDGRISGNAVNIEYHSVTKGKQCTDRKVIIVGATPQVLTSPNFPAPMPFNQRCLYDLVSKNDIIVVKVLESNLAQHCETMLMMYEGEYRADQNVTNTAKVCGRQSGIYKLNSNQATLLSISDELKGPGGWKVQVYSMARSTVDNSRSGENIGLQLQGGVILVIALFILCCLL